MTKKAFLTIIMTWVIVATSLADGLVEQYSREQLESNLSQPCEFAPLPRAYTPYWQDAISPEMRDSYIRLGEQYLGKPWLTLSATMFSEFKTNGNRTHYEGACFEKRRQLACLAMAETLEGRGRFLNDIVDGLWNACEETWWGIPAHYGKPVPVSEDQTVDLFNAESAGLIVWTTYMLRDSLNARSPLICKRVREEVNRRILRPALSQNYWWKSAGMNWNPWICSNWLACVLLCESDRGKQVDAVEQILGCIDAFMNSYPADGGCDEGPGYWDRAAASLYETLNLLRLATNGLIDLSNNEKLQAMGSFVYKTYIGGGYSVNFADSHENRAMQQVNIVYPFGVYLDDAYMRGLARCLWAGDAKAGDTYLKSGNFPTLGRELFFLSQNKQFEAETAKEPLLHDIWLPNLQIMTARSGDMFVAMKGGTNGESHNHNDVGSLIVYAANHPLLIDPGVGEYTSKTFGNNRYDIWTMQSAYHNLPQINGFDQHDGKEYHSRDVVYRRGILKMDLSACYPSDAAVKRWTRTVSMGRGQTVEVTEDYVLERYLGRTRIMLMTTTTPIVGSGTVTLGNYTVSFDTKVLEAEVEDISEMLDSLLQGMWGEKMYRIVLTVKGNDTKGKIRYKIGKSKRGN